jgi:hypothetical protein
MMNKLKNIALALIVLPLSLEPVHAQVMEFAEPAPLSILNSEAEELSPLVSADGKTLYFVRGFHKDNVGGELAGMDIWVSQKDSLGKWQKPTNDIRKWNNYENNAVIGVREDNSVVYLLNSYNRGKGIAFTKQINGKWISPELLPLKWQENKEFVGYYMHPDFNVLLISMKGDDSEGMEDLYVSVKDSLWNWSTPIHLGPTVNTEGFEISPFLSQDKQRLYFASNGHGGFGGADIFVTQRLYDNWTVWSKPINLGEKINSDKFDAYFSIGRDSTVYFSSNRSGELSNIYVSELKGLKKGENQEYAEQLIAEARQLLEELRGEDQSREYFIDFFPESAEIQSSSKQKLNDLIKFLNYQSYKELILLSVAYEPEDLGIHKKRLDELVKYLKLSGINSSKIKIKESNNMKRGAEEKLFEEKDGIVVIVSY